jgi:hypothetical protein
MKGWVGFFVRVTLATVLFTVYGMIISWHYEHAQSQDVKLYEFDHTTWGDMHLYKGVYQGCELYVIRGHAQSTDRADSVSIATGRGCK